MKKDTGCMLLCRKPAVNNNSNMHKCIITMTTHIIAMTTYLIALPSGNALLFNGTASPSYADAPKAIDDAVLLFSIG